MPCLGLFSQLCFIFSICTSTALGIYLCLLQGVASMAKAESSFCLIRVRCKQSIFFFNNEKVDMSLATEIIFYFPKFFLALILEMGSRINMNSANPLIIQEYYFWLRLNLCKLMISRVDHVYKTICDCRLYGHQKIWSNFVNLTKAQTDMERGDRN